MSFVIIYKRFFVSCENIIVFKFFNGSICDSFQTVSFLQKDAQRKRE